MTVIVFTFVLMLGSALREILPLLTSGQASFALVGQAILLLLPFILAFALPMALLTATLLVFGRFSADQELTASRASGVSLVSLVIPILLLSLALCGVSAWMNLEVAPRCRVAYNSLRQQLATALVNAELPERRYIRDFPGYIIYVGKNRKQNLQDVLLIQLKDETNIEASVHALTGKLAVDATNNVMKLHLFGVSAVNASGPSSANEMEYTLDLNSSIPGARDVGITDMTFTQLRAELADLERRIHQPLVVDKTSNDDQRRRKRNWAKQLSDITEPIRIQIHKKISFSFACFGFALVGIPLAIRVQRRETNINIAVTLLLLGIYFGLVTFAEALSSHPEYAPHILVWLPNFVFQAVGAVLLWRANRGI
jgi:lipopolysaccharide export system permease protein